MPWIKPKPTFSARIANNVHVWGPALFLLFVLAVAIFYAMPLKYQ
jgi:hypothetical protein